MKEYPILFSTPMVKAILEGRKTQTRRICKYPVSISQGGRPHSPMLDVKGLWLLPNECCPYGQVGDRLWVKETHAFEKRLDTFKASEIGEAGDVPVWFKADGFPDDAVLPRGKWRSSIFMPRWASRITLEITGVRVERVQEISEADAIVEGIANGAYAINPRYSFHELWDSVNAKRGYSWASNPWCWVIGFKRVA